MATYAYNQFEDFIAYQLLTFLQENYLKNNLRYVAEDILSHPAGNSDMISAITLNNDVTDGGAIYFADTSHSLKSKASNDDDDELALNELDLKLNGTQVIQGTRHLFTARSYQSFSGDSYLLGNGRTGWRMPYDGSFLAVTFTFLTTSFTVGGTANCEIRINSGSGFFAGTIAPAANNTIYSVATIREERDEQGSGEFIFQAGQTLEPYYNQISGNFSVIAACVLEVAFDA